MAVNDLFCNFLFVFPSGKSLQLESSSSPVEEEENLSPVDTTFDIGMNFLLNGRIFFFKELLVSHFLLLLSIAFNYF